MAKTYAGARIHALRKQRGLTQVQMAKTLGLSTSYLNQLENDQRPLTVTVLLQLSRHFSIDPSYFAGDKDHRALAELRTLFPNTDESTLQDLTARFPELLPQLIEAAQHSVQPQAGPYDFVRDFFYDAHNYIHPLDVEAEKLSQQLGDKIFRRGRLAAKLEDELGVTTRIIPTATRRAYDPSLRRLNLREGSTEAQLVFDMALHYCLNTYQDLCEDLVKELPEGDARSIGKLGLAQYFAAAVTMPYTSFLNAAEATRYDIDLLAAQFGTSFESTAQRLATLQRPEASGVPFSFIRTDRAGNISKRQSSTSFHFARTGGSCPLWVVHRGFETPNRITRQIASMPDGHTYLWVARFVQGQATTWDTPRREFVVGLGCDISQAHRLVYSDALNVNPNAATPIGPGCADCPRSSCPQRSLPRKGRPVQLDLSRAADAAFLTR